VPALLAITNFSISEDSAMNRHLVVSAIAALAFAASISTSLGAKRSASSSPTLLAQQVTPLRFLTPAEIKCQDGCKERGQRCHSNAPSLRSKEACENGIITCQQKCLGGAR